MSVLTNPLHVKKDGIVYECTCYTTENEATPTTIPGGSCWKLRNNGIDCYVGLYPTSQSGGSFHTPLKLKKNDVEYYVETKVVNNYTVTITQSTNQTITVTCNGNNYTESFTAPAGSQITVTVTPVTGYTAGAPSIASGYVNSNLSITASPASKATYLVTIVQTDNQVISVTCNGVTYTSSFTAEYGMVWEASIVADEGYNAGELNLTKGTITGAVTISATNAALAKLYAISVTQPDKGCITVNGTQGTAFSVLSGTDVTIEAEATVSPYQVDALYVDQGIELTYLFSANYDTSIISQITITNNTTGREYTYSNSDLDTNNKLIIIVESNSSINITTNFEGYEPISDVITTDYEDTIYELKGELTEQKYKLITLSAPFSDPDGRLSTLVNSNNFEISGDYIRSGSNSYHRYNGKSTGYIEFTTPSNPESILLSVTCYTSSESNWDWGAVYVGTSVYYPSSYSDVRSKVTDGNGQYLYTGSGSGSLSSYTFDSSVLQPDTLYYISFIYIKDSSGDSGSDRLFIKEIKFNTM